MKTSHQQVGETKFQMYLYLKSSEQLRFFVLEQFLGNCQKICLGSFEFLFTRRTLQWVNSWDFMSSKPPPMKFFFMNFKNSWALFILWKPNSCNSSPGFLIYFMTSLWELSLCKFEHFKSPTTIVDKILTIQKRTNSGTCIQKWKIIIIAHSTSERITKIEI